MITNQRHRNTMLQSENYYKEYQFAGYPIQYIVGCKATQGSETTEWAGSVTLLGLLPLWRATLPPDTVLAVRPPTPADCWPFRGSYGEIIIELPKLIQVDAVSVEHVRPDTARSAPKHFKIFGVLNNGTWVTGASGTYTYNKPPKQYFILNINKLVKQIIFRVLSNQGNNKYTCMYRVHLYTKYINEV
ncbi:SUN domain-containing protein 3-like [Danaus plexippus]|uniref:SUN domain-containing protein 3-like n=1 Tax=Danaus plexippus TaxID=13037 RepID=UPI002AB1CB42|nr:SUN domain-containing protein 3-like [Danaus plexippus]